MKKLLFLAVLALGLQTSAQTYLASADVGATARDWYVSKVLQEPFDPLRPTFYWARSKSSFGVPQGGCFILDGAATCATAAAKRLTWDGVDIKLMSGASVFLACNNGTGICTDNFGFASTGTITASTAGNFVSSDSIGTAGSGTGITAVKSGVVRNFVDKVTVINTAMTAAATTDVTIWTTPVNTRLVRIVAEVTQVFTGGALSAVTITCGKSAGTNEYLLSNSVFTAQNTWGDNFAEIGAGLLSATVADMGTPAAGIPGAIAISCRFTCTGANCNAATQGSITFEVEGVAYP